MWALAGLQLRNVGARAKCRLDMLVLFCLAAACLPRAASQTCPPSRTFKPALLPRVFGTPVLAPALMASPARAAQGPGQGTRKRPSLRTQNVDARRAAISRAAAVTARTIVAPFTLNSTTRDRWQLRASQGASVARQRAFGSDFAPPDMGLCVGSQYVIEAVNALLYVRFKSNGSLAAGPFSTSTVLGTSNIVTDPRCWYDPVTRVYVLVAIGSTFDGPPVMVSSSRDPQLGRWCARAIYPYGRGAEVQTDYPSIGWVDGVLAISVEIYASGSYMGAAVVVMSAGALGSTTGAQCSRASVVPAVFRDLQFSVQVEGSSVASIPMIFQPAQLQQGSRADRVGGGRLYLVAMSEMSRADLVLGAIRNTSAIAANAPGGARLTLTTVPVSAFAPVPGVPQPGTTNPLDPVVFSAPIPDGTSSVQSVVYAAGKVYVVSTTGVRVAGSSQLLNAVTYWILRPYIVKNQLCATLVKEAVVAFTNNVHAWVPVIAVAPNGRALLVFSVSGSTVKPSIAAAELDPTTNLITNGNSSINGSTSVNGRPTIVWAGAGAATSWTYYLDFGVRVQRFGDYAAALYDAASKRAWFASQVFDSQNAWQTVIGSVSIPS